MDASLSEDLRDSDPELNPPRRIKANHIWMAVGAVIARITALSGVAATVFQFHDDSEIQREVFVNIPSPLTAGVLHGCADPAAVGSVQLSYRVRNWERGAPDNRATTTKNLKHRMADFRSGIYMQTLMREPGAGIMHSLIYFNFLILLAVTTVLEINHQVPESLKFLNGDVYKGYSLVGDLAGVGFLAGMFLAILRRYGPKSWRPYRIAVKSRPEHIVINGTLLAIGITGFGAEGYRIALQDRPEFEQWSVIGYPLSRLVGPPPTSRAGTSSGGSPTS